jgi:hypothetical protein
VRRDDLTEDQLAGLDLNERSDVSCGLLQLVVARQGHIQLDMVMDCPTEASGLRQAKETRDSLCDTADSPDDLECHFSLPWLGHAQGTAAAGGTRAEPRSRLLPALTGWSGRGESNPHYELGKLEFYH